MPSPDLPQPIYPNAPTGSAQPQYPYGGRPPAEQAPYPPPGGQYRPPAPPGPGGMTGKLKAALAAGAVVLIAAVVTIVVLVNKSGDNTANGINQDGRSSTPVTTQANNQNNNNGNNSGNNGNNGTGADLTSWKSALAAAYPTFTSASIDCIAAPLAADSTLVQGMQQTNVVFQNRTDADKFAQIITGCVSSSELVAYFEAVMNSSQDENIRSASFCVAQETADWTTADWTGFLSDAVYVETTQYALANALQYC